MFWVRTPFLWVGLGTGYSLVGWVGHGLNIIFIMGTGWIRVRIYGFGLGVDWVVAAWIGYGFSFPTRAGLLYPTSNSDCNVRPTLSGLQLLWHKYSIWAFGFDEWCSKREESCPKFQYWATLELSLLIFVQSQRQSSFSMYLNAVTELVPWFFALGHTNYARWIPVHLHNITELPTRHPDIAR